MWNIFKFLIYHLVEMSVQTKSCWIVIGAKWLLFLCSKSCIWVPFVCLFCVLFLFFVFSSCNCSEITFWLWNPFNFSHSSHKYSQLIWEKNSQPHLTAVQLPWKLSALEKSFYFTQKRFGVHHWFIMYTTQLSYRWWKLQSSNCQPSAASLP